MPLYRVLEKSFLDVEANGSSRICEAGEIVEFTGNPSANLEPMDDEGRARQEQHLQAEVKRKASLFGLPDASMFALDPETVAKMAALISQFGGQPLKVPADVADVTKAKK